MAAPIAYDHGWARGGADSFELGGMTDNRDDHYQPWLQPAEPAPWPPAADSGAGIAKPVAAPPASLPVTDASAVRHVSHAPDWQARLARAAAATRRAATAFADWTIALGNRADVPTRVAALELDDKLRRGASGAVDAARTAAGAAGKAGSKARDDLAALKLGEKISAKGGAVVAVGRSRAAELVARRSGVVDAPASTAATPVMPDTAPPSGLDRLLAREADSTPAKPPLPLFADIAPETTAALSVQAAAPGGSGAGAQGTGKATGAASPVPPTNAARGGGDGAGGPGRGGDPAPWWHDRMLWIGFAVGAVVAALALAFVAGQRSAAPSRAAIDPLVRDYILENPQIIAEAMQRLDGQRSSAAIAKLRPQIETPFAGAWAGNANGDVTLVVFSDFACGFCRQSVGDIDRLLKADPGVKIVFRELPILSEASVDTARAALTAAAQGKYMAFHTAMFAGNPPSADSINVALAKSAVGSGPGATIPPRAAMDRELQANLAAAQTLGFQGTPAWVVGDQTLNGAVGYAELKHAVDAARAAKAG